MTPIRDLIALIVARVLDTRRRGDEDGDEIVDIQWHEYPPVPIDPEDERVARAFAVPAASGPPA